MKTIKQEMLMEKCNVCSKEITGYSEAQVNSRMNMHMRSHKEGTDLKDKTK